MIAAFITREFSSDIEFRGESAGQSFRGFGIPRFLTLRPAEFRDEITTPTLGAEPELVNLVVAL
jgi:hypothetical protein